MADMCYICKKTCDKPDVINCPALVLDERKGYIPQLIIKTYYDPTPLGIFTCPELKDVYNRR